MFQHVAPTAVTATATPAAGTAAAAGDTVALFSITQRQLRSTRSTISP